MMSCLRLGDYALDRNILSSFIFCFNIAFQSGSSGLFFRYFIPSLIFDTVPFWDMVSLYVPFLLKRELTSISCPSCLGKYEMSFPV